MINDYLKAVIPMLLFFIFMFLISSYNEINKTNIEKCLVTCNIFEKEIQKNCVELCFKRENINK